MTKYSVDIHTNGNWESIALFSDKASLPAIEEFCLAQFENGNSLFAPADDIRIMFLDTTEVLWDWESYCEEEAYDDDWDYNEDMGFDPYEGCYTFDC